MADLLVEQNRLPPNSSYYNASDLQQSQQQQQHNSCLLSRTPFTDSERQFILVTDVGLSSVICALGLVLNALSILVLQRDVRRSAMSVLLLALSIFDLTFLVLSAPYYVVYMGLGAVVKDADGITLQTRIHANAASRPVLPALWYLGNVARTGRNWIILLVALDRYMVVQNPFFSTQRSNPQRSRAYCAAVSCTALLYNLPLLLEYRLELHQCLKVRVLHPDPKNLGFVYMLVYKKIMYILFLTVGPMLVLTAFNILLIRSLLIASRIRAAITREITRRTEETKMLVVIIAVFVVTEIPGAVFHILMDTSFDDQTWFNSYLYSIGSLLTLFNSAINFFIYCVWSRNFRRNMLYAIRRKKKPPARVIRFDSSDSDKTRHLMLQRAAAAAAAAVPGGAAAAAQPQHQTAAIQMHLMGGTAVGGVGGCGVGGGGGGGGSGGGSGGVAGSSSGDRNHNHSNHLHQAPPKHLRFS